MPSAKARAWYFPAANTPFQLLNLVKAMRYPRLTNQENIRQTAKLTQHNHTELVATHFRGTYDDHIGGQALLLVRTLTE